MENIFKINELYLIIIEIKGEDKYIKGRKVNIYWLIF